MKKTILSIMPFLIGMIGWLILITTIILTLSPLGKIPGPAHPIIAIFFILTLVSGVIPIVGIVLELLISPIHNHTPNRKIINIVINLSYLIVYAIGIIILYIGGNSI